MQRLKGQMKVIVIIFALVFAFAMGASAQSDMKKEKKMPAIKCRSQQTPTIPIAQCTMTRDMMQTITDILVIHEKIIKSVSQSEKQQLLSDMTAMRKKIIALSKEDGNICVMQQLQSQKLL